LEGGVAFLMHLVQILLPLAGNDGTPIPEEFFQDIREELVKQFGGLTAYARAPAQGVWAHDGVRQKDDIAVVEVMVEALEEDWWRAFRAHLERLLEQEALVIRAFEIQRL
jgi:hypothetical protein